MSENDLREFNARLNSGECSHIIRDVVASLRKAAAGAVHRRKNAPSWVDVRDI